MLTASVVIMGQPAVYSVAAPSPPPLPRATSPTTDGGSTLVARPAHEPGGRMDLEDVITCKTKVDYAHKSTTTGLPNVHGHVDCDHYVNRIVVRVYIYRDGRQVGASPITQATVKKSIVGTSNAPSCVEAHYNGDEAGYVLFPAGYTPTERDFYQSGPIDYVVCGPCLGRETVRHAAAQSASRSSFPAVVARPGILC